MARTGEPRKTKQPLKIDRLPPEVIEALKYLRNVKGCVWEEIEARSQAPYSKAWMSDDRGFIDWKNLPVDVQELFPDKKLAVSTLQRWWDLRVDQVTANVMKLSVQAREIAQVFAKVATKREEGSVLNATRDILLGILAEENTPNGRIAIARRLTDLAKVQIQASTNKIRERKVAVDEKSLQAKLDEAKRKAGELMKDAEGKDGSVPVLSREDLLARVKELYGVL